MAKERKDSAHVQTKMMEDIANGIQPPVKLKPEELVFFKIITDARAVWTDIDLFHAACLARCMQSIQRNQERLDQEDDIIENNRGTPIANPRFSVLEILTRRSLSLSAKIQVHAAATIGESKLSRGKNTQKREMQKAMDDVEDDDLIARPTVN